MTAHPLDTLLDLLADRLAARLGDVRERDVYDSANLPLRTSRRRFAELCRSGRVAGAELTGALVERLRAGRGDDSLISETLRHPQLANGGVGLAASYLTGESPGDLSVRHDHRD